MKYIIYARKSTESEERQILSIESQISELREFAAKEKLEIVASLCEAQTAKEPENKSARTIFWKGKRNFFIMNLYNEKGSCCWYGWFARWI